MKLPKEIKGVNKIRDAAIVADFKIDRLDFPEIAEKHKLTERRIRQILAVNHAFIKTDKDWEKAKRINRLERRLKLCPPTSKDELEIMAELRKEIDGDDKRGGSDVKVVVVYPKDFKREEQLANRVEVISGNVS